MEVQDFIEQLEIFRIGPDLYHCSLDSANLFGYDNNDDRRTYLTDNPDCTELGLHIINGQRSEVHHVCVDGGLVTHGLWDYVGDGIRRGRFDSMIFNDSLLLLVEYKMNSTTEDDKGKWSRFSDGMKQIKDYYIYLSDKFVQAGDDIWNYFTVGTIIPFICMSNLPSLRFRVNQQRINEMEKFRIATGGLKIQYGTEYTLPSR